jgi:hypothetical protein
MGVLGLLVSLTVVGLVFIPSPLHALLLAVLFTLCLLPWFLWELQPHFYAPVYITSLLLLLSYPIRASLLFMAPNATVSVSPQHYLPQELTADDDLMTVTLLYTAAGIGAYLIFYYLLPFDKIRIRRFSSHIKPIDHWFLRVSILYAIGWVARYYQISTANFSPWFQGEGYDASSSTLLKYFSDFCEIAYIFAWVYWLKDKNHAFARLTFLALVTVTEFGFALMIQGTKAGLVRLALFPLLVSSATRGRIPWKSMAITGMVVMYFVFPFIQAYRDLHKEIFAESVVSLNEGTFLSLEAASTMYDQPRHYTANVSVDTPVVLLGAVIVLNRFCGFDSLAILLQNVPTPFNYIWGADFFGAVFALIPRAIWPEKPGSESVRIFDREILASDYATTSPYPMAEGYLNAGLAGLLLVMFATASLQGGLHGAFKNSKSEHPLLIASYTWFFYMVVNIDSWVLPAYGFLLQRTLVFMIVWVVITWKLPAIKLSQRDNAIYLPTSSSM